MDVAREMAGSRNRDARAIPTRLITRIAKLRAAEVAELKMARAAKRAASRASPATRKKLPKKSAKKH